MKRVLVIDAHKGARAPAPDPTQSALALDDQRGDDVAPVENLHWQNARAIADRLDADLIWSYPDVNAELRGGYEVIVFVHASHYSFVDEAWLEASPDARLFYVTNEYNLGEPRILWSAAKRGRKYSVLANHDAGASKVVKKYVIAWHPMNLNALCYRARVTSAQQRTRSTVYYGSYRADRALSFRRWFTDARAIAISTHAKNVEKFRAIGAGGPFVSRLGWQARDLEQYGYSLYIEDESTHTNYNYLANRFYEAISSDVVPLFDPTCAATIERAGYALEAITVDGPESLAAVYDRAPSVPQLWHAWAAAERWTTLESVAHLVGRSP